MASKPASACGSRLHCAKPPSFWSPPAAKKNTSRPASRAAAATTSPNRSTALSWSRCSKAISENKRLSGKDVSRTHERHFQLTHGTRRESLGPTCGRSGQGVRGAHAAAECARSSRCPGRHSRNCRQPDRHRRSCRVQDRQEAFGTLALLVVRRRSEQALRSRSVPRATADGGAQRQARVSTQVVK